MTNLTKGTGQIVRLLLKQHRLKIMLWLVGISILTISVAAIYPVAYENPADLFAIAITMQNPAMTAMLGPVPSVAEYTVSVAFAQEMLLFSAVAMAIMNILLTSSMTREDEEEGRLEIIRALPIGKIAYPTAAMIIICGINFLVFIVIGLGLFTINSTIFPLKPAFLYASIITSTGLFFAGLTAVAAQLSETARGTKSLAFGLLLLAYLLRAFGDVRSEPLSLLSPLGWVVRGQVFIDNHWWPVTLLLLGTVLLTAIAFRLNQRRDLFQGILPQKPGQRNASAWLQTLPGFIWSQQKISILVWLVSIFLMSAAFGAILGDLETYFGDMALLQAFLTGNASLTEEFTRLLIGIMSLFTAIPGMAIILSLKKEEELERLDHFYSRFVSRTKVLVNYHFFALIIVVIIQVVFAYGMYLTAQEFMAEPLILDQVMGVALAYIPALWFILALTTVLVGWLPKATTLAWLYISFTFIITYFGRLLELPEVIQSLSIFYHVPVNVAHGDMLWLSGLALIIFLVAIYGYQQRDIKA